MAVQVQQEQLAPCRVALTIEVPPEDVRKAVDQVYGNLARRTNVPGFRPGKAPRHLLKRFVDEARVKEMATEQALTNAYRDALKQAGVEPFKNTEPDLDLPEEEMDLEQGFSFKATILTAPHVHLGELDGLTARRVVAKIGDADVEKEILRLRRRAATYARSDEPAAVDDRIRATVLVTVDGVTVDDATFLAPALIHVGANFKEFDDGLIGVSAGENKTFEFVYPSDFGDEELQGKTAVARIEVSEVYRHTIPEATDEFARSGRFADLESMRTRLRELLQAQADAMADQEVNDSLVQEVVRRSTVHYPDEFLERETSDRIAEFMQALEREEIELEIYLEETGKDLTGFQNEHREEARQSLVNTLVLVELGRHFGVRVTDREVEEEIRIRAESEGVKLSQMRQQLRERGEIDSIQNRLFFRIVAARLREGAEIRELEA